MNRGPLVAGAGILAGLGLAALVATCGAADTSGSAPAGTALDEQCDDVPDTAARLSTEADDGFALGAAVVGPEDAATGAPVVLLRHGASHTLCDWLEWSHRASEETGATFLLVDRRGQGASPGQEDLTRDPTDVRAVLDAALVGDRPLVTMGSSMGNASAFSLFAELPKAPCAAIGVSPVPVVGGLDGVSALREASDLAPGAVHLLWSEGDGDVPGNATALTRAARTVGAEVTHTLVGGDAHARAVLDDHAEARRAALEAISACSG